MKYINGLTITIACSVVLLLPMILGNYQMIEQSTDMMAHTSIINAILDGTPLNILHYGQLIIGYPLAWIIKTFNMDVGSVYLTFNYIVLALIPFIYYFVSKRLLGENASRMVAPIAVLTTTSILGLFKYGVIIQLINVGIILPLLLYCAIQWFIKVKYQYIVASLVLVGLHSLFHISGIYLAYAFVLLLLGSLVCRKFTAYKLWPILLYLVIAIPLNMVVVGYLVPQGEIITRDILAVIPSIAPSAEIPIIAPSTVPEIAIVPDAKMLPEYGYVPPPQFVTQFLTYPTTILLILALYGWFILRRRINWIMSEKLYLVVLVCFIPPMIFAMAMNISGASVRVASDLSTIIAITVAGLLGILTTVEKTRWLSYPAMLVISVGVGTALPSWIGG